MPAEISASEYQEQFGENAEHLLIDVRELDEYAQGHLPNAINVPLSEFQIHVNDIEDDKPIVLVCATGVRSGRAMDFMVSLGYDDLYNLVDGTKGWIQEGLPIEMPQ